MQNNFKIIPTLLQILSIVGLIYLGIMQMGDWDITPAYNDLYAMEAKTKIDNYTSIDSLKVAAKKYIDTNRNNFSIRSDKSFFRFWIVMLIIAMQLVLIAYRRVQTNKQP